MGQLHLLSLSPASAVGLLGARRASVQHAWRTSTAPPAAVTAVAASFDPLGRRSFSSHRKTALFVARRGHFCCKMGKSGKLVEEEEGNLALWISYILTGAGANLISWLVLPSSSVSVGASGAVFGLFAISVLVKMSWDWRKIIEVLVLGQFVIDKVLEASTGLTDTWGWGTGYALQTVNHIAHLSGALIGAALVLLIRRIPSQLSGQDVEGDKRT
ncbi:putative Rhomboid-like protein 11, chloroplastic [Cocos nucifera]|uniref:Putative Rhomboid-like protein 11, chloroplastic n=1 Tax=Cocos nucifera TaxID=13894 RepID=A0A8K0MWP7_COCNU|nr:putative Rhomboid-like protein 11, chloroplastic [Cocos nucifera]